jgi:hypothetical protein
MHARLGMIALGMAIAASPATAAGLLGQSATGGYFYPDLATPYGSATAIAPFVIGAGQDASTIVESVTTLNFDFSDAALDISFSTGLMNPTWNASSFNGVMFTSAGFAAITGVSVEPSTTMPGFAASRVSVVGDTIRIDWGGLSYVNGSTIDLRFAGLSSAVPEPATWALMFGGLSLAGGAMRRRRALAIA